MNRNTDDNGRLLYDVFAESAPPDFREAMLAEPLRLVRRRRLVRRMRNAAGIFSALALLAVLLIQNLSRQAGFVSAPPVAKEVSTRSYEVVRTQPFPASEIVATQPLAASKFVSSPAAVEIVQTTTGNFRVINDDQLLSLLASHPAILVRNGPQSEKLVFANPEDANGFPMNKF